ncbi:BTAD domain-containing putative transcriptional regulator [Streptomyces boncukensis]|uniref:AfsR/SARP family transcriptional regulator n=1 Tax=Streptomyces boncukensis TaxID=2711219 RepID=A0A6G4WQU7_9ACTN|nr:BTAD domain-containing putative transcriptional regulator [Streptomyces boncukensis]NGO67575.1 AfsR/SARP family transcriptional regulator [Streptomyces boncukensis]
MLRFRVLGPVDVRTGDGTRVPIPGTKVAALLANLLLVPGRPVSVDQLVDHLWGEQLPGNPAGALQAKVSQLRRALDDAEPGARDLVVHQQKPPGYVLQIAPEQVDAAEFADLTAKARATDDPLRTSRLLAEALSLWQGEAFGDFADEPFARAVCGRMEEERLAALEEQAEARLDLGESNLLAGELAEAVSEHPFRERLRAVHMRALYRAGRQSEALDSYDQLRERLAEELGLSPTPALVALHQAILRQDPELDGAPGESAATPRPRTNLPTPLTELVGRDGAIAEVRSRLEGGRLVTLTGPGGVGKTRLAMQTATEMIGDFPDGVWLVGLSAHGRGSGRQELLSTLAEAVLSVLSIRENVPAGAPHSEPVTLCDRVVNALQGRTMLLVLDNCEHVAEGVAALAEALLGTAPDLRVLATSQRPLGVAGETLWAVPPLDVPVVGASGESPDRDLLAVEQSTAARLFVARAAATAPGFVQNRDNAWTIGALCRRLDGIPLALELAATRVRALGVKGLFARLDDRFRLLGEGHRSAPPRQQTLRAMIDWSWELLTEPEQAVLRRLAVHVDGCTLEAAEAVSPGPGVGAEDVPHLVSLLVDRSLVMTAETGHGPRYRMLESVVEYGAERLREAGELDRVRHAHQRYYTEFAERARPHLHGQDQQQWLGHLDRETANFRSAVDSALEDGRVELALRLVDALGWYWLLRGRLTDAVQMLADAIEAAEEPSVPLANALAWRLGVTGRFGDDADLLEQSKAIMDMYDRLGARAARARAQWFLGFTLFGRGGMAASEELTEQALDGFNAVGDSWGTAAALAMRARQAAGRGDLDAVRRDGRRSLALFQELGDRWGQLQANDVLGWLAEITGDYRQAVALHRDGQRIAEQLGLWSDLSWKLSRLGRIAILSQDYDRARELHERARRLAAEQRDKPAEHFAELGLGLGARRQGKLADAQEHLERWLDWCRQMDWSPGLALILVELGFVAEQRGDPEAARDLHLESFVMAQRTDDSRAVALALEGLAGAQALAGLPAEAARLLGAASAARDAARAPLPAAERGDVERIAEAVRQALGGDAFAAESERGRRLGHGPSASGAFGLRLA